MNSNFIVISLIAFVAQIYMACELNPEEINKCVLRHELKFDFKEIFYQPNNCSNCLCERGIDVLFLEHDPYMHCEGKDCSHAHGLLAGMYLHMLSLLTLIQCIFTNSL